MVIQKISATEQIIFRKKDNNKISTAQSTRNKLLSQTDKILIGTTLGLAVINTALLVKKPSQKKVEEMVKDKFLEEQIKNRKLLFSKFKFESFKDNDKIASIDDLAGLEQLKDFINKQQVLLKNKNIQKEHNIDNFSSLLLWGVPGTGKTTAVLGIAKKLDADFIRLDKELFDSEFISKGPRQLAEYFRNIEMHAKNNKDKNIVVFMDEIDSTISVDRGLEAKQDDVLVNTLKQGLTDLQQKCDNVIFIGATNKDPNGIKSDNTAVRLNSAVLSRFNYQFELKLPEPKTIQEAWTKLMKTKSGKDKFTNKQNEIIAQKFAELGMSFRDIKNTANKLNIEDAVEFCRKGSYNSKANLINVIKNDEKTGYDHVKKIEMDKNKKAKILEELKAGL